MTVLPPQTGDLFVHGRDRYEQNFSLAVSLGFSHRPASRLSIVHELRSDGVERLRTHGYSDLVTVTEPSDVMSHLPTDGVWALAIRCKPLAVEV